LPDDCIRNESTKCLEWFDVEGGNFVKSCHKPYTFWKSLFRLFYRSLFDCYSRWCFYFAEEQHRCVLVEPVSSLGQLQKVNSSAYFTQITHEQQNSSSSRYLGQNDIFRQLTNQTSSPFLSFVNFSTEQLLILPSKCFSAASLTAHYTMTRGKSQALNVFVHVGFEKNCTAFLFGLLPLLFCLPCLCLFIDAPRFRDNGS
jgi:hypothetical protein